MSLTNQLHGILFRFKGLRFAVKGVLIYFCHKLVRAWNRRRNRLVQETVLERFDRDLFYLVVCLMEAVAGSKQYWTPLVSPSDTLDYRNHVALSWCTSKFICPLTPPTLLTTSHRQTLTPKKLLPRPHHAFPLTSLDNLHTLSRLRRSKAYTTQAVSAPQTPASPNQTHKPTPDSQNPPPST